MKLKFITALTILLLCLSAPPAQAGGFCARIVNGLREAVTTKGSAQNSDHPLVILNEETHGSLRAGEYHTSNQVIEIDGINYEAKPYSANLFARAILVEKILSQLGLGTPRLAIYKTTSGEVFLLQEKILTNFSNINQGNANYSKKLQMYNLASAVLGNKSSYTTRRSRAFTDAAVLGRDVFANNLDFWLLGWEQASSGVAQFGIRGSETDYSRNDFSSQKFSGTETLIEMFTNFGISVERSNTTLPFIKGYDLEVIEEFVQQLASFSVLNKAVFLEAIPVEFREEVLSELEQIFSVLEIRTRLAADNLLSLHPESWEFLERFIEASGVAGPEYSRQQMQSAQKVTDQLTDLKDYFRTRNFSVKGRDGSHKEILWEEVLALLRDKKQPRGFKKVQSSLQDNEFDILVYRKRALYDLLLSGFHNVHQTGYGTYASGTTRREYIAGRARVEALLLGYDSEALGLSDDEAATAWGKENAGALPIYGLLSQQVVVRNGKLISQHIQPNEYGSIAITLKKDRVKDRSTFTVGDSINNKAQEDGHWLSRPIPFDYVEILAPFIYDYQTRSGFRKKSSDLNVIQYRESHPVFGPTLPKWPSPIDQLQLPEMQKVTQEGPFDAPIATDYIETQIFGGISPYDIDKIIIMTPDVPSSDEFAQYLLDTYGITLIRAEVD